MAVNPGALFQRLRRASNRPAAIATVVAILFCLIADNQNRQLTLERARAETLAQLSLIQNRLEDDIRGEVQLVRGLAADIATEPDIDQNRFDRLCAQMLRSDKILHNIAIAPDLVVTLECPRLGNEAAIGLDYRKNERQREAATRARDSGSVVLAGPVDLVQGGRAFIARLPVFVDGSDGGGRFWGLVSAVMDLDALYRDAGLIGKNLPIEVAILGRDDQGVGGHRFFGDDDVLAADPVSVSVDVPSGEWTLEAIPKGGWDKAVAGRWVARIIILLGGLLIIGPAWLAGRLVTERRLNFDRLSERERELQRLSRRLELALDASQVGVWDFNIDKQELVWDDRMNELFGYPSDGGRREYHDWRVQLDESDAARAIEDFENAIRTRGHYNSQFRIALGDGSTRVIRSMGRVYIAADRSMQIVGVSWDITADVALTEDLTRSKALTEARNAELEAAKARIEFNSLHDFLTRLPNRMYLERALEERAVHCAIKGGGVALLQVDLDGFKRINDTLGHPAGDAMLIHTAKTISRHLRQGDFVARTGGDEFVVVCNADHGMIGMDELARRIIEDVSKPTDFEGHECR